MYEKHYPRQPTCIVFGLGHSDPGSGHVTDGLGQPLTTGHLLDDMWRYV